MATITVKPDVAMKEVTRVVNNTPPHEIERFVHTLEKRLPSEMKEAYNKLTHLCFKLFALSYVLNPHTLPNLKVPPYLFSKYFVLTVYILPTLHIYRHNKNALSILQNYVTELEKAYKQAVASTVKKEYGVVLYEFSLLKRLWESIKRGFIRLGKQLTRALLDTADTIIQTYNAIAKTVSLPFSYIASVVPFGHLLVKAGGTAFATAIGGTSLLPLWTLHKAMTSEITQSAISMLRSISDGTFFAKLDELSEEIMQDLEWDDLKEVAEGGTE